MSAQATYKYTVAIQEQNPEFPLAEHEGVAMSACKIIPCNLWTSGTEHTQATSPLDILPLPVYHTNKHSALPSR